jgi:hypothetical protein
MEYFLKKNNLSPAGCLDILFITGNILGMKGGKYHVAENRTPENRKFKTAQIYSLFE